MITAATFSETAPARVYDTETGGMRDAVSTDWAATGDGNFVQFNNERATVAWAHGFAAGVLAAMVTFAVIATVIAESLARGGGPTGAG